MAYGSWSTSIAGGYSSVIRSYGSNTIVRTFTPSSAEYQTLMRSGASTPNFRTVAQRLGFIPINAFSMNLTKVVPWYGYYTRNRGNQADNQFSDSTVVAGNYPFSDSMADSLNLSALTAGQKNACDGRAINSLLSKAKDQKVNLAQVFAERAQTARTIGDLAISVAGALVNLRKGNLVAAAKAVGLHVPKRASRAMRKGYARRQADSIARGWLALQYGIKPMLGDIYGACEELAKKSINTTPAIARVTASSRVMNRDDQTQRGTVPSQPTYGCKELTQLQETYEVKYVAYFSLASPLNHDLAKLGILNPAMVAWELLPYSFVIDWFLPIGGWINTWDADAGLTFHSGSKTVFYTRSLKSEALQPGYTLNNIFYQWRFKKEETKVTTDRTFLYYWPSAAIPSLKNPFSDLHIANAIALFLTSRK